MAEASIPVDLFNPGQVFGCLGFLEAVDVLLGDAEGGFDWRSEADLRFVLRAAGSENPFAAVLRFLAQAEVRRCTPIGYADPPAKNNKNVSLDESDEERDWTAHEGSIFSESFPNPRADRMALPIRLEHCEGPAIDLGHWADGSHRNEFKLYAGNRTAESIARAMLRGRCKKPSNRQSVGGAKTLGVAALWDGQHGELVAKPFDVLTPMGGSFNFDPRGGWTALDAGYSPNEHADHGIVASPVVEILAPWGLEHARPDEFEKRHVRYAVWSGLLPPILARPALAGARVGVAVRKFRFVLNLSGKNKVVTFAQEETPA
jgi:CRISPR-associated protein Csx14